MIDASSKLLPIVLKLCVLLARLTEQENRKSDLTWLVTGRHISPVVDSLSKQFGNVKFMKVDLDEVHLST